MQDPYRNSGSTAYVDWNYDRKESAAVKKANPRNSAKSQNRKSGEEWGYEIIGGVAAYGPGIVTDPTLFTASRPSYDFNYCPPVQEPARVNSFSVQPAIAQFIPPYNNPPPLQSAQNTQPSAPYITGYSGPSRAAPSAPPAGVVISETDLIPTGEVLGKGYFGEVKKYVWCSPDGKIPVAVKTVIVDRAPNALDVFKQEIAIHDRLDPQYVVRFLGTIEKEGVAHGIVMEFMEYGSLPELFRRFPNPADFAWTHRLHIALRIAEAVNYLHTLSPTPIVHADIKGANVLVAGGIPGNNGELTFNAKLADFSLAATKSFSNSQFYAAGQIPSRPKGTLAWLPPEKIPNELAKSTLPGDIYAFGVFMWEVASHGKLPYANAHGNEETIIRCKNNGANGVNEPFDDKTTPGASPAYAKLSYDCWNKDAQQRPTAQQVVTRLRNLNLSGNVSADDARDKLAICITLRRGNAESERQGDALLKELISELDGYIRLYPQHWEFLEIRGASRMWSKDYVGAESDLQQALNLNKGSDFAWAYLGGVMVNRDKNVEASGFCAQALQINPENAVALRMKGHALCGQGEWEDAIACFSHASELDPDCAGIWAGLAQAENELKRFKAAIADAHKAISLDKDNASAWLALGFAHRMTGLPERAEGYYDKALLLQPNNYWALAQRGASKRMQGYHDDAINDLTRAIEIAPSCEFAYAERGDAYRLKKCYAEALSDCNRSLALFESSWSFLIRGLVLCELGRYEEAARDAKKCLSLSQEYGSQATELRERIAERQRIARKNAETYKGHANSPHGMHAAGTRTVSPPVVPPPAAGNESTKENATKCLVM